MKRIVLSCAAVLWATATGASAQIVNGSFETGDFTGWAVTDIGGGGPYSPIAVVPAGSIAVPPGFGLFLCPPGLLSAPTDGLFSVTHGFDGGGPGTITVAQDVTLGPCDTRLLFDYTAGWEMGSCACGATLPREFHVDVEPVGGGAFLQRTVILTASPFSDSCGTSGTGSVDLSAFAGGSVRISFEWDIPEFFVGPGLFDFDNVRLSSPIANGSFETGDFTGWTVSAPLAVFPPVVGPAGSGFFAGTTPSHGGVSTFLGWEHFAGPPPVETTIAQDVTLGPCDTTLLFDWKADYVELFGDSYAFRVDVEPVGGGPFLARTVIHSVVPGGSAFTGIVPAAVDISAFAGGAVRISLEVEAFGPFFIPAGLMQLELDNVRVSCVPASSVERIGILGVNPVGFHEVSGAVVGGSWDTTVAVPPGSLGSTVQIGKGGPIAGILLSGTISGELLILPPFFPADVVVGSAHSIPIPPDCSLAGVALWSQAGTFKLGPFHETLNNAIDFVIGTQ